MQNQEMGSSTTLPFKVKWGYGMLDAAGGTVWALFYIFFLFFLTDVVKMKPAVAGVIMMVGVMWDAVTDPLVGIWSDRIKSRWGRRRPFLLAMAVPFGIISWLLFTDFGFGQQGTTAYFTIMVMVFFSGYSLLNVPYTALAAEMTQVYEERVSLVTYRAMWSQLSAILGAALPLYMAQYFTGTFGSQKMGWSVMAGVIGIASIIPILWTWRSTRGYELFPEEIKVKWKDVFYVIMKNRPFRYVLGIWTTGIMATNLAGAVIVYFMTYYMGYSEDQSSIALLFLFSAGAAWILPLNYLARTKGKRFAFIFSMGLWTVVSAFGIVMVQPDDTVLFYTILFLVSGGNAGIYLLGWSMIPDVVEVDEFKTGHRREGLYFGIIAFGQKTGSALALWFVGIVLSSVGYQPDMVQSDAALWGIRLTLGEGTAIVLFISCLLAYWMPMTAKKHQALMKALELKKAGKEYDTSLIDDILIK